MKIAALIVAAGSGARTGGEGVALALLGGGILIDALSNSDGSLAPLYRRSRAW